MLNGLVPDGSLIQAAFSDVGLVLFGMVLLVFGAILVFSFFLKQNPDWYLILTALLCMEFILLLGVVSLDLAGAGTISVVESFADLSELLSTHRWLVMQLPFILLATAIINLLTFGKTIVDRHAQIYYFATLISIWLSFASLLLIGFESML